MSEWMMEMNDITELIVVVGVVVLCGFVKQFCREQVKKGSGQN